MIGGMMDYRAELRPIYPEGSRIGLRYGELRCGERIWGPLYSLYRRLGIRSDREDFRLLKAEIDSEEVARCGTLCCGLRLWPNLSDIHQIPDISLYGIETLESLLPTHFIVERVQHQPGKSMES